MKHAAHRRLMISKNLIMMLVIAVVVSVAIYAWFLANEEVEASGLTAKAWQSGELQLALPREDGQFPHDDDFHDQIDFTETNYINNIIKDVTSDGETFVVPSFESATNQKDGRQVITDGAWEPGLSSKEALTDNLDYNDELFNYVSLDFYVRSENPDIFIAPSSKLSAQSEILNKPLIGNTSALNNPTSIGNKNFSADAIVGAMRISLQVSDVTGVTNHIEAVSAKRCELLWLPRPDIYLKTANIESQWQLKTGIKPTDTLAVETYRHTFCQGQLVGESNIKKGVKKLIYNDDGIFPGAAFTEGTTECDYFRVTNIPQEDYDNLGTTGFVPTFGQKKQIADASHGAQPIAFTHEGTEKSYYVYKITLNLWAEGMDAEARRAMNDGIFSLVLDLMG